jgi:hypothetical protein
MKIANLVEDFSGLVLDPDFATDGANVTYGLGVVTLGIFTSQNNLKTSGTWDLTESQISSKVTWPAVGSGGHQCSFRLTGGPTASDTANEIRFFRQGTDQIDFRYSIASALTVIATITYDPVQHAWLRFRHSGSTVYWETSPDAIIWTVRASTTAITWDLTSVFARWTAVMFGSETGVVVVDNVNIDPIIPDSTYTFKACDGVTGVPYAFLPQVQGVQASFEMSDIGSIGFDYYKLGINASALDANRVEIAMFQDGVEMDDGRFTVQSYSHDALDTNSTVKYVGQSIANMIKGAIVYSGDGSVTLGVDQVFTGTAGGILKALFDQNAARGTDRVFDRITYASFTAVNDSNGVPWAFTLADITYRVGTNYLDVMRHMFNSGMIEFKMVGRDLRIYNAGTMGIDRTVVAEPVVLRKGRDLTEAPLTGTREQIAAVVLTQGDGGVLKQQINSSVGAAWGFDEAFLSQGGVSDDTTLGILTQDEIDRRSQIRIENTHKVALNASPWTPGLHYKTSDYIFSDLGLGPVKLRVRQMVLGLEDGGVTYASIVLNDKFLEREIAIARRVDGILGGASAGGSVAIPVGPDPGEDLTTPKDPASLSSISNVYVNEAGRSLAAVALSWPAVTQNTDTSTITDLDHYETEYKTDAATSVVAPSAFGPAREDQELTRKFDRRFKPFGWIGGDGGASVRAPGISRDVWLFADSFIGTAFGSGSVGTGASSFIHNSVVLTDPVVPATFDSRYGMGNRLTANDAFLETTVGQWQADTNCAVIRDTATFWYGAASLRITATAAADAIARIAAPPTSSYAVTAGKTYSVMAKVKTLSGTARSVQLGIRWYTAANALVSTSLSTSFPGSTTGYVRSTVADVAPATATKAAMIIVIKSAAAAQQFNCDTMGLMENDMQMSSWVDPRRTITPVNGPVALINPEDLGGAALASGATLDNAMFWVDDIVEVGGKIYGFMTRYSPGGVFQSSTAIAQWDGTTLGFEGIFAFTSSDTVQWGCTTWDTGGFLYIYGQDTADAPTAIDHYVMRVPSSNVVGGTKEYLTNVGTPAWSTTRASAVSVYIGVLAHIGNIDFRGGNYNSIITVYGSGQLRRLTASQIWGPWSDAGVIYAQPNIGSGLIAYFPRLHTQLNNNSGVSMSYSVNGTVAGVGVTGDIRYYAPKFARGPVSVQAALTPLTDWSAPRIIESGVLVDNIGDIPAGYNFQARVRAVDSNGHESIWRDGTPIRTVDDTTPPNKPSIPILSSAFKGIRVEWDGYDYLGGPPPSDWYKMEVHVSIIANFEPSTLTLFDTFITSLGGVSPIQDLIYGQIYYVRFVALDVRGNRSLPSDAGSVSPQQLVNTAEIGKKLIEGANIADSTIAVRSITVAAFEPSIVPNGGFEDEALNADGSGTGLPSYWSNSVWIIGAGGTVTYETVAPLAGTKSIKITLAAAADGLRYASAKFPVTPGRLLAASVKVKASRAIANPAFELRIVCGNTEANTGAFPSAGVSEWGPTATVVGTTAIQKVELQRIVEASMTYAQVFVTALNAADGSGWNGIIDEVEVRPVGGSAFIADASILNAKIANLAVDDAKIATVNVGKLTAGSLIADMTLSARIKTANTGARVELNSSGLQAYNSGGNQTVSVVASTGAATFVGTFNTAFAGSSTAFMQLTDSGDQSTVFFIPASGPSNYAYLNSFADAGGNPRLRLVTGEFTCLGVTGTRQALYLSTTTGITLGANSATSRLGFYLDMTENALSLQRTSSAPNLTGGSFEATDTEFWIRRYGGGILNGGQISADTASLYLDANASGTLNARIQLDDDQGIWFKGKFVTDNADSGMSALFVGTWNVGANTVFVVSYGVTMNSRPQVVYSIHSGGAPGDNRLSSFNTTQFQITQANSVAINLNYWCYRTL